jgi:hypothetical protein
MIERLKHKFNFVIQRLPENGARRANAKAEMDIGWTWTELRFHN